jgi:protein-disulfide isomerase
LIVRFAVAMSALTLVAPLPTRADEPPSPSPAVTVRLFVDLECPHSRQAWPVYRDAVAARQDVHVALHHLPLSRHPHARAAALAALAARKQGREFAFVDRLLQEPVPDEVAVRRAVAAVGLDAGTFDKDRATPELAHALDRERQAGLAFGIRATPSALLNGRGLAGAPPGPALQRALAVEAAAANSAQTAAVGPVDVEREGLLRHAPEFLPAFDALRSGRVLAPSEVPPIATARLHERWKVTLQPVEVAVGPARALVTAVWFSDPTVPWQVAQLRELLALTKSGVRVVVKPVPRDGSAQPAQAVAVALRLHAVASLSAEAGAALLGLCAQQPTLTPADVEAMALKVGIDAAALRARVDEPATSVALQSAVDLARRIDARPGSLYLNGRRWLGLPQDPGLAAAVEDLRREAESVTRTGVDAGQVYAHLVGKGAWRSDEELDLLAPEVLGDLTQLPAFGAGPVTVTLLVDFASAHSRAAFAMLRRYVDHAELPVRVQMASLASTTEPCWSAAGAAFAAAARMGKGLPFAERLFDARSPNDWPTVFAIAKKLRLPFAAFQRDVDGPTARAVADSVCRVVQRLDLAEDPVIYLGDRLYAGPLDEARIERALRFVAGGRR